MKRINYQFPEPICMTCGELCHVTEIVFNCDCYGDQQLWCYCKPCDVDTFHPGETEDDGG